MIRRPIALVLGAGASVPYGFPTARDLLRDIRRGLTDTTFRQRLMSASPGEAAIQGLREALAGSPVGSVDEFLEIPAHAGLVGVGKAAIAASLLPREVPQNLLPDEKRDDWYEYLFRRMKEGASSFEEFLQNRIVFVTFNYERSLEHFLLSALRSTYRASPTQVADAVKQNHLRIVHVYGSFGALPYGVEPTIGGILLGQAAASIHIVGEPDAQAGIDAAQAALMDCERVCFLGFGYRRANVDRLALNTTLRKEAQVFGSAFGLLSGERRDVEQVFAVAKHPIHLSGPGLDALTALRELTVLSEFEFRSVATDS
ncbi:MAG: hypothetical protein ACREMN_05940 [Gemmatimonadales bacterium]